MVLEANVTFDQVLLTDLAYYMAPPVRPHQWFTVD